MDLSQLNSSAAGITANAMQSLYNALLLIQELNYQQLNNQVKSGAAAALASANAIKESDIQEANKIEIESINQMVNAITSGLMSGANLSYTIAGSKPFSPTIRSLDEKLEVVNTNLSAIQEKSQNLELQEMANGAVRPDAAVLETIRSLKLRDFSTPLTKEEEQAIQVANDSDREEIFHRAERKQADIKEEKRIEEGRLQSFFQNLGMLQQMVTASSSAIAASSQKSAQLIKAQADYAKQLADWALQTFNLNNQISTALLNNISSALDNAIRVQDSIDAANRAA